MPSFKSCNITLLTLLLIACSGDGSGQNQPPGGDVQTSNSPDTSVTRDGGDAGEAPGGPIDAPAETWTWVEFPQAVCGNGAATGVGVNLTDRSDDVFVYFMGGGACWDVNSCFVFNSAVNIESGYGEAKFENEPFIASTGFDRDSADNPFRDMSWVYVPYCTGDLHAGDRVTTYMALGQTRDIHHRGAANVDTFLARLTPTLNGAERIFIAGSSAGGYGAQFNFHRFVSAFPGAEVHLLSDAAPLVQPYGGRFNEMDSAWTMPTPPGCDGCGDGFPQWFDYLAGSHPESRIGLLAYDADQTIHLYFGYPIGDSFRTALDGFFDDSYTPVGNAHPFVLSGTDHVLLDRLATISAHDGTRMTDWIQWWIEGSNEWDTIRP